jgi:hypothetical protein
MFPDENINYGSSLEHLRFHPETPCFRAETIIPSHDRSVYGKRNIAI